MKSGQPAAIACVVIWKSKKRSSDRVLCGFHCPYYEQSLTPMWKASHFACLVYNVPASWYPRHLKNLDV